MNAHQNRKIKIKKIIDNQQKDLKKIHLNFFFYRKFRIVVPSVKGMSKILVNDPTRKEEEAQTNETNADGKPQYRF